VGAAANPRSIDAEKPGGSLRVTADIADIAAQCPRVPVGKLTGVKEFLTHRCSPV